MDTADKQQAGWKQKVRNELIEYWTTAIYLALFFSFFTNYRRLVLAEYGIGYQHFGIALIKALVLAKIILIVEELRLSRRFETRPLIIPTLYKSFFFTLCVAVFNSAESLTDGLIHGEGLSGALGELFRHYNYEWLSGMLVVFFAFLPFFAFRELRDILGERAIYKLFFKDRSALRADPKAFRSFLGCEATDEN